MEEIRYTTDISDVDWTRLKAVLAADAFDNGRTPAQYAASFANSAFAILARTGDRIVGTLRVLSDGICNAYIVDVWTHSQFRRRGIAAEMLRRAEIRLPGQHIYLFTDNAFDLYLKAGYRQQGVGLGKVSGQWLQNNPPME